MIIQFDKKKLGVRIRQIRLSKGMTQDDVCDKLFMDTSMLSNYESGKTAPSLTTLVKIVNALETTFDELFDYEHLTNAKELSNQINNECKKLPIAKLQALYRFLQILKEIN